MKAREVITCIDKGSLPLIRFSKQVEIIDSELDQNMIGRVVSYIKEEDYFIITIDVSEYLHHNKIVAKCNYFDDRGKPCLSVFETKFMKNNRTELYIMPEDDLGELVTESFEDWWKRIDTYNMSPQEIAQKAWNASRGVL